METFHILAMSRDGNFFFMLSSADHEISYVHMYKNTKKFIIFSGSDKPRMLFFLLINVKMPTIVGILTFMSRKNFMLSSDERGMFYNLGARFLRGVYFWSHSKVVTIKRG